MIVIKTLLPFLAELNNKKSICFYEPESDQLHSMDQLQDEEKNAIIHKIKDEIVQAQQFIQVVDVAETQDIPEQFDKMKEEYDNGKYEFPDIQL